ncbi:MAG: outer membrane protein assembly factor BamD [Polyangiaceae bacterium]
MSTIDLHPEELLDREREGRLTESERERLDAHAAECASCRLERSARSDFDAELDAADDDPILDRAIDGALARSPARPRRSPRTVWLLAAAAVLATVAAVAAYTRSPAKSEAPIRLDVPSPVVEAPAPPPIVKAGEPASEPELAVSPLPDPEPSNKPKAAERPPSAAELFASANQARRDKNDAEAIRLYRNLQARYPESREAKASRVMLGQLMLDKKDPNEALGEFDKYLKEGSKGAVTEEAIVGRALSLQKLGRTADERAAWQELLAKFPGSVHAAQAKQRLAATAE